VVVEVIEIVILLDAQAVQAVEAVGLILQQVTLVELEILRVHLQVRGIVVALVEEAVKILLAAAVVEQVLQVGVLLQLNKVVTVAMEQLLL
jgi:hypothetical protein